MLFLFKQKPHLLRYTYMTIFNPTNTTHIFKVIPRDFDALCSTDDFVLELFDENKSANITVANFATTIISFGYVTFTFDATLIEGTSYSIKIIKNPLDEIVFRGKAFATVKETQNYNING